MTQLANTQYYKMNGIGNAIVVLDLRGTGPEKSSELSASQARAIGQTPGLHFDQLMVVFDPVDKNAAGRLKIYNIDGSLSASCGNGTRCVAWMLFRETDDNQLWLESDMGRLECRREGPLRFTVDMGAPKFGWQDIPLSFDVGDITDVDLPDAPADAAGLGKFHAVNMGNPHAVFFSDKPEDYDLLTLGPLVENHPLFPERVNLSIAKILSENSIRLKVWERGAGATLACGSAACATLVAAARKNLTGRKANIQLPGGTLEIEWRERDSHVLMTGDVELEQEGQLDPQIFSALPA